MPFKTPNFTDIRDQLLRDIKSQNNAADVEIDSDFYIRASSIAACAEGQYAHQNWIIRQIFPDTADTEFLEIHAATRAIYRKNATIAKGTARIYGENKSVVPAGITVVSNGLSYTVDNSGVIDAKGLIDLAITATDSGAASNIAKQTSAMLTAAPAGCRTECMIIETLGGTNPESDKSLLERLLERIRRPPAGGNKHDYRAWALSVAGVSNAYVYPIRRGLGSVDIAITSGDGLPSPELIIQVQDFIDGVRPVTAAESLVIMPNAIPVNFNVQVAVIGISLADAKKEIDRVLKDYFARLAPADPVIISQIEALISDIIGVVDRKIVSPTKNIESELIKSIDWFRLGTVTVSQMV